MSKPLYPFTKDQLLPQEEKLEILKEKGNLFIGIPKETHLCPINESTNCKLNLCFRGSILSRRLH